MKRLKPKAKPAKASGVPLTPIMPPWTITQEVAETAIALVKLIGKLQTKPTPRNAVQEQALQDAIRLQQGLSHQDIYLP